MGFFERIKKKERIEQTVNSFFKTINAYTPCFTTFEGGIYESELCRAAIHTFAQHVSKFKPEVLGNGNKQLERKLQFKPNPIMDTKKFLYRLATIYSVDNNALIAPLTDYTGTKITGYYPLLPEKSQIVDLDGNKYIRYQLTPSEWGAVELERCGILTQYQYKDEYFGSSNTVAMRPTLELIHAQNQGIIEGIKNSAAIRFLAKISGALKPKDIEAERKRFVENNLSTSNNGGVMMFDSKYEDVKQIDSKPYVVNPTQMSQIRENVYTYFGVNQDVLQNKYNSSTWNAYYEGKLEPFALELSLVMTNMTFTGHEIAYGNQILFTANRLQYLEPQEKLNVVTQLFDRGMLTQNMGLEIFNLPTIGPDGDKFYIRKEYWDTSKPIDTKKESQGDNNNADQTGTTIQDNGNAVSNSEPKKDQQ